MSVRATWIVLLLGAALVRGAELPRGPALPATISLTLADGVAMTFALVQPGRFVMGSEPHFAERDETPQHAVTISRPFYIGTLEVTQAQWVAVMGSNPSKFQDRGRPVENVSWTDCQAFCAKLSAKTGRVVVLPTEAQWEYACRGGTPTRWFFGDTPENLRRFAWYGENAESTTHPGGTKTPNPWGLFDVYGNVWEWCADWYQNPYPAGEVTDPTGPGSGDARVTRGGAWGDDDAQVRSAYRNSMGPEQRNAGTGLRCVLLVESTPPTDTTAGTK